jgi:hypothetical protein
MYVGWRSSVVEGLWALLDSINGVFFITGATVVLLRGSGPYGITFMTVYYLDFSVILDGQFTTVYANNSR